MVSSVAAQAILRIAEKWGIEDRDWVILLAGVSILTIQRWRNQLHRNQSVRCNMNRDQLDRVSYILGVYIAQHTLFEPTGARLFNPWEPVLETKQRCDPTSVDLIGGSKSIEQYRFGAPDAQG